MDQKTWLNQNGKNFSPDLNGYSRPPIGPYQSTLPFVNRGGAIIDLGCGNGMLLKFLMEFSGHILTPYGIDVNYRAIEMARELLPNFNENFSEQNVNNYQFPRRFNLIISNPFYSGDPRGFVESCINNLPCGGRFLGRVHEDVLKRIGVRNLEEAQSLQGLNLNFSKGDGLDFCIFDKIRA